MMRVFFGSLLTSLLLISSVAAAEDDIVAKHWDARAVAEPEETIPDDVEGNWGKWHFWNGQWWARAMFQPEAAGPSWDAPKNGLKPAWNQLKGVWLRARRKVPSEAKDARILLSQNGIRGCAVIVFVNRTKAGEISAPAGELEITKFVKIGAENEFHLLLASGETFVINATLTAGKGATEGVFTVDSDLSGYPRLFVVGIGPKVE